MPSGKPVTTTASNKEELTALQSADPEFYAFLLENDKEILDSEEEMSEIEEQEDMMDLDDKSLENTKKMTKLFRRCFEDGDFNLDNVAAFEQLTVFVFGQASALCEAMGLESTVRKYSSEKHYFKHKNAIRNLLSCFIHFIDTQPCDQTVDDKVIENPLMCQVLASAQRVLLLSFGFPTVVKRILMAVCGLFGKAKSALIKSRAISIAKMCVFMKSGNDLDSPEQVEKPLLELAVRQIYKHYLEQAAQVHEKSLVMSSFMRDMVAKEILGLDLHVTYLVAFRYLRQIANVVRLAYDDKSEKRLHQVYGWSCMQGMNFWGVFIAMHAEKSANLLNAVQSMNGKKIVQAKRGNKANLLIYPFVQLANAILQLQPVPRHYAFRFHMLELLLKISAATETMIPTAQYLLEVLQSALFTGKPKNSSLKMIEFTTTIRISQQYLNTTVLKNGVMERVQDLFIKTLAVHATQIYFPDWCVPIQKALKHLQKHSPDKKYKTMLGNLILKIQESSDYISKQRAGCKFGPLDLELIADWQAKLPKQPTIVKMAQSIERVEDRMRPQVPQIDETKQAGPEDTKDQVRPLLLKKRKKSDNRKTHTKKHKSK